MTSKYVDSQDDPEPMLPVPFSQGQRSGIVVVVATVVVTASTVTSVDELALESLELDPELASELELELEAELELLELEFSALPELDPLFGKIIANGTPTPAPTTTNVTTPNMINIFLRLTGSVPKHDSKSIISVYLVSW